MPRRVFPIFITTLAYLLLGSMKRNRRSFIKASGAAAVTVGVAGCIGGGSDEDDGVIRFGLPTSLSGPYSQLGTDYHRGFQIWVDDINERGGLLDQDVELIHYDDESDPDRSRQLAERLVSEDDVDFLFGPYGSPTNYAACLVADQTQTPMVSGAASDPDIFDRGLEYFYSVLSKTTEYGVSLPEFISNVDWGQYDMEEPTTFAGVRAEAAFTDDLGAAQIENFEERGFELVHESTYPVDIDDFSGILSQIEQADPDILALCGFPGDEARFAEQMQQADLNVDVHSQNYSSQPVIIETLGEQVDYMLNGAWWDRRYEFERVDQYVSAWEDRHDDRPPEMPLAYSTATGMVFETAIGNAGSTASDDVNQELKEIDTETTMGRTEFHETGWSLHAYENEAVRQWQNQEMELLYPEKFRTGDPWFPAPEWGERDEPPA